MSEHLKTRTAISVAVNMDVDAPVKVRLGLFDDRVVDVVAWSKNDEGGLLLVLSADHDHFPVGRSVVGTRRGEQVRRTQTEHAARGLYMTDDERAVLRPVTTT